MNKVVRVTRDPVKLFSQIAELDKNIPLAEARLVTLGEKIEAMRARRAVLKEKAGDAEDMATLAKSLRDQKLAEIAKLNEEWGLE